MAEYSKDAPFNDPVVRCDACQTLLLMAEVHQIGQCSRCSGTKVRNLRGTLTVPDCETLIAWRDAGTIDPEFVKLFIAEGVPA
jgi:hypothetical protein